MNNFFGIPIFQNNPQRVSRAQQQKRRIGYFLFHGYDTNFPFDLENRFIVVGDDEDDDGSDDDVIEIGSGHSKNDPKFLGPVEMVTIEVGGFEVQMPKIQDYVIEAFNESLKLEPTIQLDKVSYFLETVIRTDGKINDLVDRIIMAGKDTNTMVSSRNFKEICVDFLKNWFPNVFLKDIRDKLVHCDFNLKAALKEIREDKNLKYVKSPRSRLKCIVVNDILVSIQILEIYKEEEKRKEGDLKKIKYETEKSKGNLVECECCFELFLNEDMASCPKGHKFCKNCLNTNVLTFMGEGRTEIKCLTSNEECNENVPIEELIRFVDKKVLQNLFRIETENAIIKANLPNIIKCWKCGYIAQYEGECDFECPQCKFKTCKKCGEASHTGISCEKIKQIDKNRFIEEQMNEAVIRVCPKCKAQFMKEEGCNKMECPRCGTWICYWCRKEIPPEVGYQHFWREKGICPPDKCPLWVENKMLHHIEAIQAAKENENKA